MLQNRSNNISSYQIPLEIWRIVLLALPSMRDVIYTAQTCRHLYSAFVASFLCGARTIPTLNGMFSGTKSPNSISLWLQSETNHPSRGYWIKMSQEALSGYRHHRRWTPKGWTCYGEFRVSNLRPTRDGSIITIDMVPLAIICEEHSAVKWTDRVHRPGEPKPAVTKMKDVSFLPFTDDLRFQGTLHLLPTKDNSSLFEARKVVVESPEDLDPTRMRECEFVLDEHTIIESEKDASPADLERMKRVRTEVEEAKKKKSKREERDQEFEAELAKRSELEEQWKQERLQQQQQMEEKAQRKAMRTKYSYEKLMHLVSIKSDDIKEAQQDNELLSHLKDEDFPFAFEGKTKEEFLGMKSWQQQKLLKQAGLF